MQTEKRRYPRYAMYRATEVQHGESPVYLGVTKDLSRSGVRMLTLAPLEAGEGVNLRVVFDENQDPVWLPAKVVRCEDVGDYQQIWRKEISLSFLEEMPELYEKLLEVES